MINKLLLITLILGVSLSSCKKEEAKIESEISLERWTVKGDSSSYEKDKIQYLETKLFNEKGEEKATAYYDENKAISGKETRVFSQEDGRLQGAQFRDAVDSLLSFYTFTLTANGKISLSKAFDARTNELLRQESFTYNSRGDMIGKNIMDASGNIVRKFEFTVDKMGNEMEVRVLNPDNSIILVETFKVTKTDHQNNWIEKWGFVDDQPFSYLARKITYQ